MANSHRTPGRNIALLGAALVCAKLWAQIPPKSAPAPDWNAVPASSGAAPGMAPVPPILKQSAAPGASWAAKPAATLPSITPSAPKAVTSAASTLSLPKNLFSLPDSLPVKLGDRVVTAGELKRGLRDALSKKSHSPVRTVVAQRTLPFTDAHLSAARAATLQASAPGGASAVLSASGGSAGGLAARTVPSNLSAATQNGVKATLCRESAPKIAQVGTLTSGVAFQIAGSCFGTAMGSVTVVGNLPGGSMRIPLLNWSDNVISAQMPPVSGYGDGVVAITVVSANGARSPDASGQFIAARERVDVSAKWTPDSHYEYDEVASVDEVSGTIGEGQPVPNSAQFKIAVNPMCALDNMTVTMRAGYILNQQGFADGPLYAATSTITVAEACLSTYELTTFYGVGGGATIQTWNDAPCRAEYDVAAYAYCPVGVAP